MNLVCVRVSVQGRLGRNVCVRWNWFVNAFLIRHNSGDASVCVCVCVYGFQFGGI